MDTRKKPVDTVLTIILASSLILIIAGILIFQKNPSSVVRKTPNNIKCSQFGIQEQVTLIGSFFPRCEGKGPFTQVCGLTDILHVVPIDQLSGYFSLSNLADFVDPKEIVWGGQLQVTGYLNDRKIGGEYDQLMDRDVREFCIIGIDTSPSYFNAKENIARHVSVTTDRNEYKAGDYAYLTIANNLAYDLSYSGPCAFASCTKLEDSNTSCTSIVGTNCADDVLGSGKQVVIKFPQPLYEGITQFGFGFKYSIYSYLIEARSNEIIVHSNQ